MIISRHLARLSSTFIRRRKIHYHTSGWGAPPAPLPHPDDIVIDMKTGLVRVNGPMTKEEKVVWDRFRERKAECDQTIAELEDLLRQQPAYAYRDAVLEELEQERKVRAIISRALPD